MDHDHYLSQYQVKYNILQAAKRYTKKSNPYTIPTKFSSFCIAQDYNVWNASTAVDKTANHEQRKQHAYDTMDNLHQEIPEY